MPARDLAEQRRADRLALEEDVESEGTRLWSQVETADLSGSWQQSIPRMTVILAGAQQAAASGADEYVDSALRELNVDTTPDGRVNPSSLSGQTSDGRSLLSLLLSPVITAKVAIGGGATVDRAMAAGNANLRLILRTQVADAGRVADGVAVAARPKVGYVRQVSPPCCPRCAVLAGKWYRYSQGFQRHPGCDCGPHIPAPESIAGDLTTDPRQLFESGQIRGLSKADTQAITDGADMNRVINAHRGMYTADGGRKATRALAGRQGIPRMRIRPEQIYRDATSRSDAIRLLRLHGYLS